MGREMLDGAGDTHRMTPLGIDGKGQCAVGQGIGDGAVGDAKPIDHVFADGHAACAFAWRAFHHLDAQPLAHLVGFHHSGHNGVHHILAHGEEGWVKCI